MPALQYTAAIRGESLFETVSDTNTIGRHRPYIIAHSIGIIVVHLCDM